MRQYPSILAAGAVADRALWPVVDAIVGEIETTSGHAKIGEYDRCAAYLAENGFRSWSADRIRQFRQVGVWIDASARRTDFTKFPFERVRDAKDAAKSNHAKALALLAGASTKRDIRPQEKPSSEMSHDLHTRVEEVKNGLGASTIGEEAVVARFQLAAARLDRAALAFTRLWNERFDGLSEDAKSAVADIVTGEAERLASVFEAMETMDVDAVVEKILDEEIGESDGH